jgi:hypothetical protein
MDDSCRLLRLGKSQHLFTFLAPFDILYKSTLVTISYRYKVVGQAQDPRPAQGSLESHGSLSQPLWDL